MTIEAKLDETNALLKQVLAALSGAPESEAPKGRGRKAAAADPAPAAAAPAAAAPADPAPAAPAEGTINPQLKADFVAFAADNHATAVSLLAQFGVEKLSRLPITREAEFKAALDKARTANATSPLV